MCIRDSPFTLFAYGETRVSSALAGIGNAVTPIATLLAAMVFLPSDRPTRRKVTGVLLGLLGVVVILQPWRDLGRPDLVGFGATLLAGTSYGLGWVYNRRTIGGRDLGGLAQPTAQLVAAGGQLVVVLLGWWLVNRSSVALPWSVRPGSAPLWPVLAVLALGVLGTGVAFAFQSVSYTHLDVYKRQGQDRVAQRLPLGRRGSLGGDIDRVGAHPLPGELERGASPVSYTHLDVYKRQPWTLRRPAGRRPSHRPGQGRGPARRPRRCRSPVRCSPWRARRRTRPQRPRPTRRPPVSYTHLDVYKRQIRLGPTRHRDRLWHLFRHPRSW